MRIEVSVLWDEAVQKWHWRIGRVVKDNSVLSGLGHTPHPRGGYIPLRGGYTPLHLRDGYTRFRGSAWRAAIGAVADLKAEKERNERNSARNYTFETVI